MPGSSAALSRLVAAALAAPAARRPLQGRRRRNRRRPRPQQVREELVGGVLLAEAAFGPEQGEDECDPAGDLVEVVDAGEIGRVERRDRGVLGVGPLDPDRPQPRGADPVQEARLEPAGQAALLPVEVTGRGADDDQAVEVGELPARPRKELAADPLEQRAPDDDLPADARPQRLEGVRVRLDVGEAGVLELAAQIIQVRRLADDADRHQLRPRRLPRRLDVARDPVGQTAQPDHADPPPLEASADQNRIDALGEVLRAAELAAEVVGPFPRRLQVAREALLEVLAGAGDDVVAELGADQDADREREEHGSEGGRVVAGAVPHSAGSLDWAAENRPLLPPAWRFRESSSAADTGSQRPSPPLSWRAA